MKKTKQIFFRVLIITITITALIFILRMYNDKKYQDKKEVEIPEYYNDVTNLSLYPTDIDKVDVTYVNEGKMQGFRLVPQEKLHKGVIICFGGSEGSPNYEEAARLAKEGYETFALFMFGMENQEKTLRNIPLEQFEDVLKYINQNVEEKNPITLLGASKGAEYILNLASKYKEIDNLILIAPSAYNFAGLDFENYGSSWSYQGEELPYVDIKRSSFPSFIKNIIIPSIVKSPIIYKDTYKTAIEMDSSSDDKLIPADEVKADILMIVGEEDKMWHSLEMANKIKEKNPNAKLYSYKGAGHIFSNNGILDLPNMRIATGGTYENNKKASDESSEVINNFLKEKHQ